MPKKLPDPFAEVRQAFQHYLRTQTERGNRFVLNPFASNLRLLTADPLELRRSQVQNGPSPLVNFQDRLEEFWSNAEKYLYDNRLKGDDLITEADLALYEQPDKSSMLTEGQKNALQVFRCIRRIQEYLYPKQPIYEQDGPIEYEPIGFEEDRPFFPVLEGQLQHLFAEFALEVMHLTLAAIKCDFYDMIWPHTHRGAAALHGSRLPRDDNLNKVIIRELETHGLKQSALEVLASIEKTISHDSTVYEITPTNSICWFDERVKARETKYHDFEKRVSKLKKRLRLLPRE